MHGRKRHHEARLQSPHGPLALADLIGLDVVLSTTEVLHRSLAIRNIACQRLKELVDAGYLGRKTRRGVYAHYTV
jgi:3-hydroxybutyryl-CoA dehydrogenase